ncbi:MAG: Sec-independent protein translocase protein TatB [Hyphomicrobiales bacterium]
MLDIGWSELLVVAVVAIVVVGPKDLPKMMRTVGFYVGKVRRAASDFQRQFEDAMRESEAEDVRKNIESIRSGLESSSLDAPTNQPVMMPKTESAPAAAKPSSSAKRKAAPKAKSSKPKPASAKPAKTAKTASAKRATTKAKSKT